MAIKHYRLDLLARWFHRCPACGGWLSLRVVKKSGGLLFGKKCDYKCSKCGAHHHDWKPSHAVKF
ncbi:MAG: hypothetical protein Q9M26_06660 [Mariprofundales bacterium]|nr:hypothetical protein [Mariprofundales bacterium]